MLCFANQFNKREMNGSGAIDSDDPEFPIIKFQM